MRFSFTLDELRQITGAEAVEGTHPGPVTGIASLKRAKPEDLSFLAHKRYAPELAATQAGVVLVPIGFPCDPAPGRTLLRVSSPNEAITAICRRLEVLLWPRPAPGVHATAFVDPSAQVDASVTIGPHCVLEAGSRVGPGSHLEAGVTVGRNSRIGSQCWIGPRCVLYPECSVGDRVRLHAGVVIGADGFGYEFSAGRHVKVPQVGTVEVAEDVEIGANSCIDRGRFGATVIGAGSKLDNLVQIGHNCVLGRHCIIVAQVGIAGSTVLGDYVMIGGQAGLAGHIEIGAASKIAGQSGVAHDLPPKSYVMGTPSIEALKEQKFQMLRHRFPEALRRLEALEEKVSALSVQT